jgi:hypothetical protein
MKIKIQARNNETKILLLPVPTQHTISYKKKGADTPKNYTISTPISVDADKITAYVYAGKDTKPGIRTFKNQQIVDFS